MSISPPLPTRMMVELAAVCPARKFTVDASGRLEPLGYTVAKPAATGSVTVTVTYDVAADQGGVLTNYTLTADSRRGPAQDAQLTAISTGLSAGVTVTPDAASVDRLPSPPNYTETFTVVNNGDGPDTFDLVASSDPAKITIVSVNGVAGASTSVAFTSGESIDIDVI